MGRIGRGVDRGRSAGGRAVRRYGRGGLLGHARRHRRRDFPFRPL